MENIIQYIILHGKWFCLQKNTGVVYFGYLILNVNL